jgi:hypothetical protein
MGGNRNAYKIVIRQSDGKRRLVDLVIDGRIILKLILKQ